MKLQVIYLSLYRKQSKSGQWWEKDEYWPQSIHNSVRLDSPASSLTEVTSSGWPQIYNQLLTEAW